MLKVQTFTFNPFGENTYVISGDSGQCAIVDPGCMTKGEQDELVNYITSNNLTPVRLLLTHLHVDHIIGNSFVCQTYALKPEGHVNDEVIYNNTQEYGKMLGLTLLEAPPTLGRYIDDGEIIVLDGTEIKVIQVPGHSPGSVCFYAPAEAFIIVGDVLFSGSVGRTDLWGGDADTLLNGIKNRLFVLPEETIVYCGHGPSTSIGNEKKTNPFFT